MLSAIGKEYCVINPCLVSEGGLCSLKVFFFIEATPYDYVNQNDFHIRGAFRTVIFREGCALIRQLSCVVNIC